MFHIGMWRERMRNALAGVSEGKDYERYPPDIDEFNDAELAHGIGTPLTDAAARADHLMGELIEVYEKLGDRPFDWNVAKTTTEAVLRNSYTHPRLHMFEYYSQNDMPDRARAALRRCSHRHGEGGRASAGDGHGDLQPGVRQGAGRPWR